MRRPPTATGSARPSSWSRKRAPGRSTPSGRSSSRPADPENRRPALAVFDIDGTLTRTTEIDEACYLRAFRHEFGIDGIDADWSRYRQATDPGTAEEIFFERWGRPPRRAEMERLRRRFIALLEEASRRRPGAFALIPGALDALDALARDPDWSAALATGAWGGSAALKLELSGLGRLALPVATGDDHPEREEIVRIAIRRAARRNGGDSFGRTVLIGDGVWDARAARRLELAFVGIGEGAAAERLRRAGAARVLPDYRDLGGFLASLAEAAPPIPAPAD